MERITKKSVGNPDETREFPKGRLEVVTLGELVFGRATFAPGWRWSASVKPIAKTEFCQVHHNGYVVSGKMTIRMQDGSEVLVQAGDVFVAPPGHDAWVEGDQPCVMYDFAGGAATYATRGAEKRADSGAEAQPSA